MVDMFIVVVVFYKERIGEVDVEVECVFDKYEDEIVCMLVEVDKLRLIILIKIVEILMVV